MLILLTDMSSSDRSAFVRRLGYLAMFDTLGAGNEYYSFASVMGALEEKFRFKNITIPGQDAKTDTHEWLLVNELIFGIQRALKFGGILSNPRRWAEERIIEGRGRIRAEVLRRADKFLTPFIALFSKETIDNWEKKDPSAKPIVAPTTGYRYPWVKKVSPMQERQGHKVSARPSPDRIIVGQTAGRIGDIDIEGWRDLYDYAPNAEIICVKSFDGKFILTGGQPRILKSYTPPEAGSERARTEAPRDKYEHTSGEQFRPGMALMIHWINQFIMREHPELCAIARDRSKTVYAVIPNLNTLLKERVLQDDQQFLRAKKRWKSDRFNTGGFESWLTKMALENIKIQIVST